MTGGTSVARRLLSLNEALESLAMLEAGDAERLASDRVLRAAVERWLQVAIEACIDIAQHACAARGWPPPDSARAAGLRVALVARAASATPRPEPRTRGRAAKHPRP